MDDHLIKKLMLNKGFVLFDHEYRNSILATEIYRCSVKRYHIHFAISCYVGLYGESQEKTFNICEKIEDTLFNIDKTL